MIMSPQATVAVSRREVTTKSRVPLLQRVVVTEEVSQEVSRLSYFNGRRAKVRSRAQALLTITLHP